MKKYFFTIITYDITDDRRRNLVAKELENYGYRVQYSVFEALLERHEIMRLKHSLARLIERNEDSIRIYVLTKKSKREIIKLGIQKDTETQEENYFIF